MDNTSAPENTVVEKRAVKKSLLFKILLPLFLLVVLIFSAFFFKDKILKLLFSKDNTPVSSTENTSEQQSPFGDLVGEQDAGDDAYFLSVYEDYQLGNVGFSFEFQDFDEKDMVLNLKKKGTENFSLFKLSSDFLIICTNFDVTNIGIDYSKFSETDKIYTAERSLSVSKEKKYDLLNNYLTGSGLGVIFNNNSLDNPELLEIRKLLLFSPDPDSCYED